MIAPYYLLDTNIISEIFRPFPNETVLSKLTKYELLSALPATGWNELLFGVQRMTAGKKKDYIFSKLIDDIQATYPIIPYDRHAAWIQADIRNRLADAGVSISFQDSQIAAIAVSNNMILVTRNMKHFEPVRQVSTLLLENWFDSDVALYQRLSSLKKQLKAIQAPAQE